MAIVGIGGVGSVAAEMLTRCGIGRLLMYGECQVPSIVLEIGLPSTRCAAMYVDLLSCPKHYLVVWPVQEHKVNRQIIWLVMECANDLCHPHWQ